MTYPATLRYARISPRKVRPLADMIRGLLVDEALDILRYQPQRGARMLEKLVRSAIGSAQDPENPANKKKTIDIERLIIVEARVDGGPMMKRVRPRARGMAHVIRKRSSHIHVVLEEM